MSVPILMYHHIEEPPERGVPFRSIWVHPKKFARQMRLLKLLGYKGVSLKEAVPYIAGDKTGKVVAITFDDGAMSVFNNAMPVLDRLGFTATNFFVSDYIGKINGWDKPPLRNAPTMGIAEMKEWAARGHEAGGHTLTHPHLPDLPLDAARTEIIESKKKLEDIFGFELVSFAYPFGEENQMMRNFVREAGYLYAVTCEKMQAFPHHDLLGLPRYGIRRNNSLFNFLMKCTWRKNR